MSVAHKNLAVAVGAAKEQARLIVFAFRRRATTPTGQSSAVYLSLIVMHKQLLDAYPPPLAHFIPDLDQMLRGCSDTLATVKPLIEAALRVARDGHDAR